MICLREAHRLAWAAISSSSSVGSSSSGISSCCCCRVVVSNTALWSQTPPAPYYPPMPPFRRDLKLLEVNMCGHVASLTLAAPALLRQPLAVHVRPPGRRPTPTRSRRQRRLGGPAMDGPTHLPDACRAEGWGSDGGGRVQREIRAAVAAMAMVSVVVAAAAELKI